MHPIDLFASFKETPLAGDSVQPPEKEQSTITQFNGLFSDRIITSQAVHEEAGITLDQGQALKKEQAFSFVAISSIMKKVCRHAELLAQLNVPVVIVGESGTGKEALARLIHSLSNRSANTFLKVSCPVLDKDTMELGLFDREPEQVVDQAIHDISPSGVRNGSTVFFDDIDEMPPKAQAKLICLLQEKELFSPSNSLVHLDLRILAATKTDLKAAVLKGKLRKDLYYYLSAFTIVIPPLRQRKDDIPVLLSHFITRFASNYGLPVRLFSASAVSECQRYSWPGNLSELEMFVKRYLVSGEKQGVSIYSDFHKEGEISPSEELIWSNGDSYSAQTTSSARSLLHSAREEAERNTILRVLEQTRWNRRVAARLLNVSYRTLLNKIQQYDMNPKKQH